jgi:hypothetical protein
VANKETVNRIADRFMARVIASRIPRTKRLLSMAEAARYIGQSQCAVRNLIAQGLLSVTRLDGKTLRIDGVVLDSLILERGLASIRPLPRGLAARSTR